ncbi:oxidoreductase [Spartinivicinus poritis]|uniref:Oxidoreductase n=1 Tax=Spartinivicinus poritis TaxID=2994640 RepID=A0ABT5UAU2_9GAMM|nr:oxidoreductase [Spartinivicinus sp. A2-2]MDE1463496.1 oxidoreductase [Spartinivicinus sp. A2-2]
MIKTGIIGYGFSAQTFHLPFIKHLNEFELTAISSSKSEQVLADNPGIQVYDTAEQLIKDNTTELVIITSPNDTHYDLAKLALANGKHVIVEKPFVTQVAQGEELIALAKEKGLVLSTYHNRRWDGDFLTINHLIETKALGEIRLFESHFDRFRPTVRQRWREQAGEGTGIWYDLGSHLVDQALCLFGWPKAITACCRALRENSQVTDYFHVQLHYPNHEVVLRSSPFSAGPGLRFQVEGTKGSFVKYGLDPQEDQLKQGGGPASESWARELDAKHGMLFQEEKETIYPTLLGGYQHYFRNIAQAIMESKTVAVTVEQALAVIKIIQLAERSSAMGQTISLLNE